MGKVSVGIILLAFLMAFTAAIMAPSTASLMPVTFGFPAMVHSGQAVSFSNDLASATDFESMNIGFPIFDGFMSSSGMPSAAMDNWPMPGMATLDPGNMNDLFSLSSFKFH